MGGFKRRDDALFPGEDFKGAQRRSVGDDMVCGAPGAVQPGVFRAYAGIIEARGDGMRRLYLPVRVLQQHAELPVQHSRPAEIQRRGVVAAGFPRSPRLKADQTHRGRVRVGGEGMEDADGVGPAAYTGQHGIRQPSDLSARLFLGFLADDGLQVAHQGGERMGTGGGAETIMRVGLFGNPGAQGLVDGVLEGARAAHHGHEFGAEQPHTVDVGRLAFHIHRAHVNGAVHAQLRRRRRRGYAMLAGARFRDQLPLAHLFRQQGLAESVVHLMRAGMHQVFPFEPQGKAEFPRQRIATGERRWPAREVAEQAGKLPLKRRGRQKRLTCPLQFPQGRHEQFRHKLSSEIAKPAFFHDDVSRCPALWPEQVLTNASASRTSA